MIYLASPFFNEKQLDFVKRLEEAFDFAGLDYFSPRSEGILIEMSPEEKAIKMQEIFQSNINHIVDCSIMVAVIDDYDTGTVWEMGLAYGLERPIYTISDNDYGLNVMIRQSTTIHNTNIDNLIINIMERMTDEQFTIFDELTKEVT